VSDSFTKLCSRRNVAAYGVVGTAQVAVAYLQLGETEKAINLLLGSLTEYQVADRLIDEFHKETSNGNHPAAA
jgi:hypothetical protein